jgi:hypothetical protein
MKSRKNEAETMLLKELKKHLTAFITDRDDTLFFDLNEKVIKIYVLAMKSKKLVHPASSVNRKANHSVKPVLMKRPRTEGKQ